MSHCQCVKALVVFLAIGLTGVRAAGNDAVEEAAIRKMIAAVDENGNKGASLPDFVFWSGAYKKPVVSGSEKGQPVSGEGSVSDRVAGSQKIKTEPNRIVIADSKDLAYEYSNFTMEFKTKGGKEIKFSGGVLRVWQKQDGAWKQAAIFARGFDD